MSAMLMGCLTSSQDNTAQFEAADNDQLWHDARHARLHRLPHEARQAT